MRGSDPEDPLGYGRIAPVKPFNPEDIFKDTVEPYKPPRPVTEADVEMIARDMSEGKMRAEEPTWLGPAEVHPKPFSFNHTMAEKAELRRALTEGSEHRNPMVECSFGFTATADWS